MNTPTATLHNRISNQKEEISWFVSTGDFRISKPASPIINVTINWLMLPVIVNEIAFSRLPSFIYNTLPKYSPTRLGVVTENETPDKTALKAVKKSTV